MDPEGSVSREHRRESTGLAGTGCDAAVEVKRQIPRLTGLSADYNPQPPMGLHLLHWEKELADLCASLTSELGAENKLKDGSGF